MYAQKAVHTLPWPFFVLQYNLSLHTWGSCDQGGVKASLQYLHYCTKDINQHSQKPITD